MVGFTAESGCSMTTSSEPTEITLRRGTAHVILLTDNNGALEPIKVTIASCRIDNFPWLLFVQIGVPSRKSKNGAALVG